MSDEKGYMIIGGKRYEILHVEIQLSNQIEPKARNMLVDSHRCPECGSTSISIFTDEEEDGEQRYGSCNDCDHYEPERFFKFTDPKYLPTYRQWEDGDHCKHVNLPLKEDGIRFWRETLQDEDRGEVYTNIRPFCDDGTGFEWGYAGSGPARFALNIIENVLREEGYTGGVFEPSHHYKGVCYRQSWRLRQNFKEQFLVNAAHNGATIPYQVVTAWLKERISDFEPSK
jgi:hypothetical protein